MVVLFSRPVPDLIPFILYYTCFSIIGQRLANHCSRFWSLLDPSKHKTFVQHLYNVGPTSSTLVQRCINVIQMFCVCFTYCLAGTSADPLIYTDNLIHSPGNRAAQSPAWRLLSTSRLDMTYLSSLSIFCSYTYVRLFAVFNPFNSGIDFRRHILTSTDNPRTKRIKKCIMAVDP